MLDDQDEFRKVSLYGEMLLDEAKSLISVLRSGEAKNHLIVLGAVNDWHSFLRNFMIKHALEIDFAIREALNH